MEEIHTGDAPAAIGPYSQGIVHDDRIFVSGQGPIDPDSGDIVGEDIREETERTLENVAAVLAAADSARRRGEVDRLRDGHVELRRRERGCTRST